MKQLEGQLSLKDMKSHTLFSHCDLCVCNKCLYRWSNRCPYGHCYDDRRAKEDPFDLAHPERSPRKMWSNWNLPGEQAHWCRGGIFYPVSYCEKFVKYKNIVVEECVAEMIAVYQDGYISCGVKNIMGCDACMARANGQEIQGRFKCEFMTDTGCEKMIRSKNLMLDAISRGEVIELCREQCCIDCTKICSFRCGQST